MLGTGGGREGHPIGAPAPVIRAVAAQASADTRS